MAQGTGSISQSDVGYISRLLSLKYSDDGRWGAERSDEGFVMVYHPLVVDEGQPADRRSDKENVQAIV